MLLEIWALLRTHSLEEENGIGPMQVAAVGSYSAVENQPAAESHSGVESRSAVESHSEKRYLGEQQEVVKD